MGQMRSVIRQGLSKDRVNIKPLDGELLFDADKQQLRVGWNGDSFPIGDIVEGPHDKLLYAKVPDHAKFIPIGVKLPDRT